jgi:hypothetical protein
LSWRPLAPSALPGFLATWLSESTGVVLALVDGPESAEPDRLAAAVLEPLHALGRPAVHVRSVDFWRDASLRLEFGREDVESFRDWVDVDALRREVLDPARTAGRYLPTLRDPSTNRSTRVPAGTLEPDTVLLVSGGLLLGHDLPFDRTVHLSVSPAARSRRTAPEWLWTLAVFDDYDRTVRPADVADVVVKLDDARHPAVRCR